MEIATGIVVLTAVFGLFAWLWVNLGSRIDHKVNKDLCEEKHISTNDSLGRLEKAISNQDEYLKKMGKALVKIQTKLDIENNDDI